MKDILLFALCLSGTFSAPAGPASPAPLYDTTRNIAWHADIGDYRQYIGQELLFYERCPRRANDPETALYDNFELAAPDTVWYGTRRKKATPRNCRIVTHYRQAAVSPFSGNPGTPCSAVEGRCFTVTGFDYDEETFRLIFTLQPADAGGKTQPVRWTVSRFCRAFPCIVVSFLERTDARYRGRTFAKARQHEPTDHAGTLSDTAAFRCAGVEFLDLDGEYITPYLILDGPAGMRIPLGFLPTPRFGAGRQAYYPETKHYLHGLSCFRETNPADVSVPDRNHAAR